MKAYLAGPMSSKPGFNFALFDSAAAVLRARGHEIVSPAEMDRALGFEGLTATEEDFLQLGGLPAAMRRDLAALLTVDAIIVLPGWDYSLGTKTEMFVAQSLGLPIFFYFNGEPLPNRMNLTMEVSARCF